jgi:hypothetical protein
MNIDKCPFSASLAPSLLSGSRRHLRVSRHTPFRHTPCSVNSAQRIARPLGVSAGYIDNSKIKTKSMFRGCSLKAPNLIIKIMHHIAAIISEAVLKKLIIELKSIRKYLSPLPEKQSMMNN